MSDKKGQTALITGASSGLGAVFAQELARQGYHMILVARRIERLESLACDLSNRYGISVQIVVADLSKTSDLERVEAAIEAAEDLSLLVNNAGYGLRDRFSDGSLEKHLTMIQVHVIAPVRLIRKALPGMISRRQGGIINVASMAAFFPYRSTSYAATKSFLVTFSKGLQHELAGTGVRVQALCPGFFYSEFHETPELSGFKRSSIPRILWLRAEDVVRESLDRLPRGSEIVIPGLQYKLASLLLRGSLTSWLITRIARARFSRRIFSEITGQKPNGLGPS